ncbi:MAG: hypothetical protein MAG795_00674 [Candidatus Woesearchaeota archaeon]|nr:hypothetical protein [Candidatus Woesearchaeota archaeon]
MEFMLTFVIAFFILIPIIYVFHNYTSDSTQKRNYNQINIIGNDIVNNAESVYYMGQPARLTLVESMPSGIQSIYIESNWTKNINELVFQFHTGENVSFFSNVNINASFNSSDFSQGIKEITLDAVNDSNFKWVEIQIE